MAWKRWDPAGPLSSVRVLFRMRSLMDHDFPRAQSLSLSLSFSLSVYLSPSRSAGPTKRVVDLPPHQNRLIRCQSKEDARWRHCLFNIFTERSFFAALLFAGHLRNTSRPAPSWTALPRKGKNIEVKVLFLREKRVLKKVVEPEGAPRKRIRDLVAANPRGKIRAK